MFFAALPNSPLFGAARCFLGFIWYPDRGCLLNFLRGFRPRLVDFLKFFLDFLKFFLDFLRRLFLLKDFLLRLFLFKDFLLRLFLLKDFLLKDFLLRFFLLKDFPSLRLNPKASPQDSTCPLLRIMRSCF